MIKITNDMPTAKRGGRKLRNDFLLIAAILFFIILFGLCLFLFSDDGDIVTVTIDGKLYATFSLSDNMSHDIITGNDPGNINRLVIKDGKAYVEYATCPDGICAAHRPISRTGESIICLPNKVVIKTTTSGNDLVPDIGA